MAVGAVALLPVGIAGAGSALLNPHLLLLGAGVALLSSVVPYSLEMAALRRISPSAFGVFMSLEPAIAALVGWLVLRESPGAARHHRARAGHHRRHRRHPHGQARPLTLRHVEYISFSHPFPLCIMAAGMPACPFYMHVERALYGGSFYGGRGI